MDELIELFNLKVFLVDDGVEAKIGIADYFDEDLTDEQKKKIWASAKILVSTIGKRVDELEGAIENGTFNSK